jgi:hypothetical protein
MKYGIKGLFGKAQNEKTAYWEIINEVKMECGKCGNPIEYKILDRCPCCGFIKIECKKCKIIYEFGE